MLRSEVDAGPPVPADQGIPQPSTAPSGGGVVALPIPGYRRTPLSWRDARFICILAGIVLMSFADLSMTLLHATSVGMVEENPIARLLMRYGGIGSICAWKAGTVTVGIFILWRIRRFKAAEVGAWVSFFILGALCLHWAMYNAQVGSLTGEIIAIDKNKQTSDWVVMRAGSIP